MKQGKHGKLGSNDFQVPAWVMEELGFLLNISARFALFPAFGILCAIMYNDGNSWMKTAWMTIVIIVNLYLVLVYLNANSAKLIWIILISQAAFHTLMNLAFAVG